MPFAVRASDTCSKSLANKASLANQLWLTRGAAHAKAENGVEDGEVLQLDTDRPLGTGFHRYRMAPGTMTKAHSHIGLRNS